MFRCCFKCSNDSKDYITEQLSGEINCNKNQILNQEYNEYNVQNRDNVDNGVKINYKNTRKAGINIFLAKEFAKCDNFICRCCEDFLAMVVPLSIFCSIVALIIFMV